MRSWSTTIRLAALLLCVELPALLFAQSNGSSPYSAYGFGDLVPVSQSIEAQLGGAGVAVTEPFAVFPTNPASYVSIVRPCFEGSIVGRSISSRTSQQSNSSFDAEFRGLRIGVPFGKRNGWGMALGVAPYSDVGYTLRNTHVIDAGTVTLEYTGTGGVNKAFAGVARRLMQRTDTAGNLRTRLAVGANFDFLFGEVEQTNKAIYPFAQNFTNTQVFSSLVLNAPTGDIGLHWSGQLVTLAAMKAKLEERKKEQQARIDEWRSVHPDTVPYPHKRDFRDAEAWRYQIGLTGQLPATFSARRTDRITTYLAGFNGVETTRDTVSDLGVGGNIVVPPSFGLGVSVFNSRWMFSVEGRTRDWSQVDLNVADYSLPGVLRNSTELIAAARFTPAWDGTLWQRTSYRAGARYSQDYQVVNGSGLNSTSLSFGASFPVNAAQTNSSINFGVELGQRGSTSNGLIEERYANIWIGLTLTPWKGERWFKPYQIQ